MGNSRGCWRFDGIDVEAPLDRNAGGLPQLRRSGRDRQDRNRFSASRVVNIANFALGRERAGSKPVKALAVVAGGPAGL